MRPIFFMYFVRTTPDATEGIAAFRYISLYLLFLFSCRELLFLCFALMLCATRIHCINVKRVRYIYMYMFYSLGVPKSLKFNVPSIYKYRAERGSHRDVWGRVPTHRESMFIKDLIPIYDLEG